MDEKPIDPKAEAKIEELKTFTGKEVDSVRCPLCRKFMVRQFSLQRGLAYWRCDIDRVAIRVDDPFVGRWEEAQAKSGDIPCPNCNASMRFFCNSTGFMKAVCPKRKCGAAVESKEPDRIGAVGETTKGLLQ